jgi:Curli production assembly/transport component CsgG/Tetratricopeptide repeat
MNASLLRRASIARARPALALLASPLLLALGCGTVLVRVPVMKPAEVNMAPYNSIGVGQITYASTNVSGGQGAVGGLLEQELVNSGRFTVVDRQRTDAVMRELRLSASDLADPSNASKLGRQVTAGALIFGDVNETYQEQDSEEHSQDKDNKVHTKYKKRGTANVRATFRVVDVSTGRLLISKQYAERREDTNTGYDKKPDPIDRDGLLVGARGEVVQRFLKAIVPHQEFANANFQKDGDLPQLEAGITWAQRGEWKKAQDTFNGAIQDAEKNPKIKSETLAKAYFDLGLSFEYAGDYDKAEKTVEKAFQLSNNGDYLNEVSNIKQLQADQKRLAEQAQQTGTN